MLGYCVAPLNIAALVSTFVQDAGRQVVWSCVRTPVSRAERRAHDLPSEDIDAPVATEGAVTREISLGGEDEGSHRVSLGWDVMWP